MSGKVRLRTNYITLHRAHICSRQAPTTTYKSEDSRTHTRWSTPALHPFVLSIPFLHPHTYTALLSLMNVLTV